jgi:hypothetical protein
MRVERSIASPNSTFALQLDAKGLSFFVPVAPEEEDNPVDKHSPTTVVGVKVTATLRHLISRPTRKHISPASISPRHSAP